ncbi:hypothetical protein GOBAR_AA20645 [Gossypium barbadense]|uniref:Uncharacterized protein n=1 Tax=Gossypium barbadense TaxID=3634 RepID=A0A2P5X9K9_GOSBA|nr:hypothetical protein GOBAR_AA20645 [Gossypium barbadense]
MPLVRRKCDGFGWSTENGRLVHLHRRIEKLSMDNLTDKMIEELIIFKIQLYLEIDKGEKYWEQRVQANWLCMVGC